MKKTYLLLLLSIFMVSACSSDDDNNDPTGDAIEITANVKCKIKGSEIAELRAPMMLFTHFNDFDNYNFDTNKSIFIHKTTGEKRNPQKKSYTDDKGFVKISDNVKAENCVIVIQSAQYPLQYEVRQYPEIKEGAKINLGNFLFTD